MILRVGATAIVAALALSIGTDLSADGGDWTGRYFGLGWGDGYHAPPRTWGPKIGHGHGHGHAGDLMPGGYPVEENYAVAGSGLPEWLWDPTDPDTVVVDTATPASPAPAPRFTAPPADPSLDVPGPGGRMQRTSPEAGRYRPVQARTGGWPR